MSSKADPTTKSSGVDNRKLDKLLELPAAQLRHQALAMDAPSLLRASAQQAIGNATAARRHGGNAGTAVWRENMVSEGHVAA